MGGHGGGIGVGGSGGQGGLTPVRAFYLDLAHWAVEDPARRAQAHISPARSIHRPGAGLPATSAAARWWGRGRRYKGNYYTSHCEYAAVSCHGVLHLTYT